MMRVFLRLTALPLLLGLIGCAGWSNSLPPVQTQGGTETGGVYYKVAVTAIMRSDYATALDYLQAARAEDPQDVRVLNAFGVIYDKLGRFDLSRRYYAQAVARDPKSNLVAANMAYSRLLQAAERARMPLSDSTARRADAAVERPRPQIELEHPVPAAPLQPPAVAISDSPEPAEAAVTIPDAPLPALPTPEIAHPVLIASAQPAITTAAADAPADGRQVCRSSSGSAAIGRVARFLSRTLELDELSQTLALDELSQTLQLDELGRTLALDDSPSEGPSCPQGAAQL